jgi:hypothetical protein
MPLSRQREQIEALRLVTADARNRVEEIKGTDPALVEKTYHGKTYHVPGVVGANMDASTLEVAVDSTNPNLLVGAGLPVLTNLDYPGKATVISLAGMVIAVFTGLHAFYRWDQSWILLRNTEGAVALPSRPSCSPTRAYCCTRSTGKAVGGWNSRRRSG